MRLHVIEADAIFSHQFASSKPLEERPSQADNRSLQNPVNLERDTFSDWSMQGFVVFIYTIEIVLWGNYALSDKQSKD